MDILASLRKHRDCLLLLLLRLSKGAHIFRKHHIGMSNLREELLLNWLFVTMSRSDQI